MSSLVAVSGYLWLGLGAVLLALEWLFAFETTLWLGVAALFVSPIAFARAPLALQVGAYAVFGFVLWLVAKKSSFFTLRPLREGERLRVNPKELVGRTGVVLIGIDGDKGSGLVSLDGEKWVAKGAGGRKISQGTEVEVVSVRGLKLIVVPKTTVTGSSR